MRCRIAVALLLVASLGCDSSPAAPSPTIASFQYSASLSHGSPPNAPSVHAGAGQIEIRGDLDAPDPCYTLEAELSADEQALTVRVTAQDSKTGGCVQVIGRFSYSAVIDVPEGTYLLSIVHTYPGTGWPTTEVLRETVTVD